MEYTIGKYEYFGNLVIYDGDTAFDVDGGLEIPIEVLSICIYIGSLNEES